jgi:hypothetical protein
MPILQQTLGLATIAVLSLCPIVSAQATLTYNYGASMLGGFEVGENNVFYVPGAYNSTEYGDVGQEYLPSYGTLTGVTLSLSADIVVVSPFTNNSSSPYPYDAFASVPVPLTTSVDSKVVTVTASGTATGVVPPDTSWSVNIEGPTVSSGLVNDPALTAYATASEINMYCNAGTPTTGGNPTVSLNEAWFGGNFAVTYTYASVPEPASIGLIGVALTSLMLRRSRKPLLRRH